MEALAYLFDAKGGVDSAHYKVAKGRFQHTFSQYRKRAVGLAERERQRKEDEAIDTRGSRSPTPEVDSQESWRTDPLHGWDEHLATLPQASMAPSNDEFERWLAEPCLPREILPEVLRLYMQSKQYSFPIICQIARDYHTIPATSAPAERVFSMAGNLISKKRTRIASENVRYVLCLRSWGIFDEEEEEEEILISEEGNILESIEQAIPVIIKS